MQATSQSTPSTGPRCMIVIRVWAMARGGVTEGGARVIRTPPVKCKMLTPRAAPSWLTRMKSSFGPWNQVAIM